MSALTIQQHITEAMEYAGNTGLQTRLATMYPVILRNLYRAAPWPCVRRTMTSLKTVAANAASFTLTRAQFYGGTPTALRDGLMGVHRAVITKGQGDADELDVQSEEDADPLAIPLVQAAQANPALGKPTRLIVYPVQDATEGKTLVCNLYPRPDVAYQVGIVGLVLPYEDLATLTVYPALEDDQLIINALVAYCYMHQGDERAGAAIGLVSAQLAQSRAMMLRTSGRNKKLQLSRKSYGSTRGATASVYPNFLPPWW